MLAIIFPSTLGFFGISVGDCATFSLGGARVVAALLNLAVAGIAALGVWAFLAVARGGHGALRLAGQLALVGVGFAAIYVLAGSTSC